MFGTFPNTPTVSVKKLIVDSCVVASWELWLAAPNVVNDRHNLYISATASNATRISIVGNVLSALQGIYIRVCSVDKVIDALKYILCSRLRSEASPNYNTEPTSSASRPAP